MLHVFPLLVNTCYEDLKAYSGFPILVNTMSCSEELKAYS